MDLLSNATSILCPRSVVDADDFITDANYSNCRLLWGWKLEIRKNRGG